MRRSGTEDAGRDASIVLGHLPRVTQRSRLSVVHAALALTLPSRMGSLPRAPRRTVLFILLELQGRHG